MIILVLNCGSSSIKYQVLSMTSEKEHTLLAKGLVERIGMDMGAVTHNVPGKEKFKMEKPIGDHTLGISEVLSLLVDPQRGVLKTLDDIDAVGHRVAHGGESFNRSVVVSPEVVDKIQELCALAPLHNPANLLGIKAVMKILPKVPQTAVFDTSFHQTMPDYAFIYSVPYEYYKEYGIRRYGFHGTSHKFVAQKACEMAGRDFYNTKVITCHLGNGGSVTACLNGKSVDTSMGFTPLEGMVMGTRSGDIDPSIVTFLQEKAHLSEAEVSSILNKKSGLLGISGISSDCRDIANADKDGSYRAHLALETFRYRVLKYVGAYAAVMNGVDIVAFTGGIGENDPDTREYVGTRLGYLGAKFDSCANEGLRGQDRILSTADSRVVMAAVTTDEELVIATDTMLLTTK